MGIREGGRAASLTLSRSRLYDIAIHASILPICLSCIFFFFFLAAIYLSIYPSGEGRADATGGVEMLLHGSIGGGRTIPPLSPLLPLCLVRISSNNISAAYRLTSPAVAGAGRDLTIGDYKNVQSLDIYLKP